VVVVVSRAMVETVLRVVAAGAARVVKVVTARGTAV
jgi:hypothetical protein